MKRILAVLMLLLTLVGQAQEGRWRGTPSVALYTATPLELTLEQLAEMAPDAEVRSVSSSYSVKWEDVEVVVNPTYRGDFKEHLAGMRGFVEHMSESDPEGGKKVLGRIATFKQAVGTQISPTFDKDGKAMAFVLKLAKKLNATIFTAASFYDAEGNPILYNGGPKKL